MPKPILPVRLVKTCTSLKFWVKSLYNWGGKISIGVLPKNSNISKLYPTPLLQEKYYVGNPENWTQYTLIGTITTQPNDTIVVRLSAGGCEVCIGGVLFDLIELEKISQ